MAWIDGLINFVVDDRQALNDGFGADLLEGCALSNWRERVVASRDKWLRHHLEEDCFLMVLAE